MSHDEGLFVKEGLIIPQSELSIKACRASGSGGQHVNKTSTKVQLKWYPLTSAVLNEQEKLLLQRRLKNRLSREGCITCAADDSRSQSKNIETAKSRLIDLILKALHVPKARKATKPSKGSKERRLKVKKQRGQVKAQRQKKNWD